MSIPPLRSTVLPLSLLLSFGAFAARGVLKADGIIRVKGADLHSATVTVVPGNAASYGLPVGSKHITLDLPLDDVYLISVQREGCPTKEVYFDTRVPVEMHGTVFQFPFQVTLESLTPERMFVYEGPVGFVRYVHALKDFGYETRYIIRVEEELKERMRSIRETGVDPKVPAPIASAIVVDRPPGEHNAALGVAVAMQEGTIAPMVGRLPRMVHVVSSRRGTEGNTETRGSDIVSPIAPVITVVPTATLPAPRPRSVEVTAFAPVRTVLKRDAVHLGHAPVAPVPDQGGTPKAGAPLARGEFSRTEELISEPSRVTRIVRFTEPNGAVQEYRRVTHAFGAVYYFQDDRSITERDFAEAIAR